MAKKAGAPSYRSLKSLHKKTFDQLASVYAARFEALATKELFLLGPLVLYLFTTFKAPARILDVGCGTGGTCAILQRAGFKTYGIDLSPKMLELAARASPKTEYAEGDFLSWQPSVDFHGICAKAVLHLFDENHADQFVAKVSKSLVRNGAAYFCVGGGKDGSGALKPKDDYPGEPQRFRRNWEMPALLRKLTEHGLSPIYWAHHHDYERSKEWLDCWAIKVD